MDCVLIMKSQSNFRTIKAVVAYDGTHFKGLQLQGAGERTVQGVLETALTKVLKARVRVNAASRTDTGVHAEGQTIHFKVKTAMPASKLRDAMNFNLPRDVAVRTLRFVVQDFNSRYHAKAKHYRYCIHVGRVKPVFRASTSLWVPYALDVEKMKQAAKFFVGKHDFTSFTTPTQTRKNRVRQIRQCSLKRAKNTIQIDIKGDGFLYRMVRIIVGTLVEVGRGVRAVDAVPVIFKAKDRHQAGRTAKAHGLTLVRVYY